MDTVLGAKTARLTEIGATEYKSYGVLGSSNKNLLRRLIEELLLEGYIATGEYQILKLRDISRLKNTETKVLVKITDEDKMTKRNEKPKKNKKGSLRSIGRNLYPFIYYLLHIFLYYSNKSLTVFAVFIFSDTRNI